MIQEELELHSSNACDCKLSLFKFVLAMEELQQRLNALRGITNSEISLKSPHDHEEMHRTTADDHCCTTADDPLV
jgi:hypothetical protein